MGNYRASVIGPLSTGVVGEYVDIILKPVIDSAKAVFPAGLWCPLIWWRDMRRLFDLEDLGDDLGEMNAGSIIKMC